MRAKATLSAVFATHQESLLGVILWVWRLDREAYALNMVHTSFAHTVQTDCGLPADKEMLA